MYRDLAFTIHPYTPQVRISHFPFHLWDLALCWKRSWKHAHVLSVPRTQARVLGGLFLMVSGEEDVGLK